VTDWTALRQKKLAAANKGPGAGRAAPSEPDGVAVTVKNGPARCAYCHGAVKERLRVACSACLAVHHGDCWKEHRSCASCGKEHALRSAPRRSAGVGPEALRAVPRLLTHEGHLRAIALWNILLGALLALMGVVFFVIALSHASFVAGLVSLLPLSLGVTLVLLGRGLWSYFTWARWGTILVNFLCVILAVASCADMREQSIFQLVVNAAWALATFWALTSGAAQTISTDLYRKAVAYDPRQKPSLTKSPFFSLPVIYIAFAVVLACVAGGSVSHSYYR
jgi:predicted phage tail protein